MVHLFRELFDHKEYQRISDCCRNRAAELTEDAKVDLVVHDNKRAQLIL